MKSMQIGTMTRYSRIQHSERKPRCSNICRNGDGCITGFWVHTHTVCTTVGLGVCVCVCSDLYVEFFSQRSHRCVCACVFNFWGNNCLAGQLGGIHLTILVFGQRSAGVRACSMPFAFSPSLGRNAFGMFCGACECVFVSMCLCSRVMLETVREKETIAFTFCAND